MKGTPRRWLLLPWIVLLAGVPASLFSFVVIRDAIEKVAELRFERLASDAKHVIQTRIDSYGEILYGLAAFFESQESVNRLQFHRYVASLDLKKRFPGFDVVNYAVHVRAEDKERFEEGVRRDTSLDPRGYPNFRIKPPGDRPEYYVLVYVEPMAGFEFAFGLDTGANPAVKDSQALGAAVRLTRDSGTLNSPGLPIRIKREDKQYVGLAMRLGVYRSGMPRDTVEQRRAAFVGSVGAGFNVENLMKGVLDENTARRLRFRLYGAKVEGEGGPPGFEGKRWLLYDSRRVSEAEAGSEATESGALDFSSALPMEVGGRAWKAHFSARKDAIIDPVDAFLPWVILSGGLMFSVVLFGMFYSLAYSRSRAVALANEMTKDLRQSEEGLRYSAEQLQALSRRLVDVQETERRQFSRELHDRVGQNLTALSINLDILRSQLKGERNEGVRSRLDDASALLESTVGSIENVMSELRPPMLDDYGLLPALQWYANEFSRRTGLEVTVDGDEGMQRLPQAGEIALFRIMQEALINVAKHAHARSVHIGLEHLDSEVVMAVSDDGVGLDAESGSTSRRRPGLGMVTMRERTQAVGGSFQIDAVPGGGTRVTVRVPFSDGDQNPHRG
jgi:signal transduction histidine kinase